MASKTTADVFRLCSAEYNTVLREEGPLLNLFYRFAGHSSTWDAPPLIQALEKAVLLEELDSSYRQRVAEELAKLPSTEENYESKICDIVARHVYPFCWEDFFVRRVSLTYNISKLTPFRRPLHKCVLNLHGYVFRIRSSSLISGN